MRLQGSPQGSPEDDGPDQSFCPGTGQADETDVSLDELLDLGELHYARSRTRGRRKRLSLSGAATGFAVRRSVVKAAGAIVATGVALVFVDSLAPDAMPEVCSTLALVLATEFMLRYRKRATGTATGWAGAPGC